MHQQCIVFVWVCDEGQQVGHVLAGDLTKVVLQGVARGWGQEKEEG
jgi:hypothetical protein